MLREKEMTRDLCAGRQEGVRVLEPGHRRRRHCGERARPAHHAGAYTRGLSTITSLGSIPC